MPHGEKIYQIELIKIVFKYIFFLLLDLFYVIDKNHIHHIALL